MKITADEERFLQKLKKTHTYEEAIEEAGNGKFQLLLLAVCGFGLMASAAEIVGGGVIMYAAQCDLQFTLREKGFLATATTLGMLSGLYVSGFLCDTRGRAFILKWSLRFSILSSILSVFSMNTWMLIVIRFFTGIFISSVKPSVFTFLGEFHTSKTKNIPITILSSCLVVGILYVNVVSYIILPINFTSIFSGLQSWRVLLLFYQVPALIASIGLLYFPESPKFLLSHGQDERALEVLRHVYSWNKGTPSYLYPVDMVEINEEEKGFGNAKGIGAVLLLMWEQTLQILERKRIFQTFNMCIIDFTISVIGIGLTMWLPTILKHLTILEEGNYTICEAIRLTTGHQSNTTAVDVCSDPNGLSVSHMKVLIVISAGLLIYYLISSAVVKYIGRKNLLIVWFILGTICSFSMYWTKIYFLSIFFLSLICQIGKFHGIVISFATDFYPSSISASGVSFIVTVGSIGLIVGGNLAGHLFLNHCEYMFFGYGVALVIIVILTCFLPSGKRE